MATKFLRFPFVLQSEKFRIKKPLLVKSKYFRIHFFKLYSREHTKTGGEKNDMFFSTCFIL